MSTAARAKSVEFSDVLKLGRTQLQDAVPMTLGQEFGAFAVTIGEDADRINEVLTLIAEINLGGTAIGTGLNAHPAYAALVCERLRDITGLPLTTAGDLVEATSDVGAFVHLSGITKRTAVKLSKICNDLRLLSSGPRAGFGEINLPAVQAGSSIMPGKVNPVIPEVVNQVAFEVIGNDLTVTMAAEAGQLQLNAFEPIIARALLSSLTHLTSAIDVLGERCIDGITANPSACATQCWVRRVSPPRSTHCSATRRPPPLSRRRSPRAHRSRSWCGARGLLDDAVLTQGPQSRKPLSAKRTQGND